MSTNSRAKKVKSCLLVVESDMKFAELITESCHRKKVAPILSHSVREAATILGDANFMDQSFDGLLLNSKLPYAMANRLINEFRCECSGAPVAMLYDRNDLSSQLWSNAPSIRLLKKPLDAAEFAAWLDTLNRVPAGAA